MPYEALFRKLCQLPLCLDEVSERKLIRPELVQECIEKVQLIRRKLWTAQNKQKRYINVRCRPLELQVEDHVLKISPTKSVIWFSKSVKPSPRSTDSFKILDLMTKGAYCKALTPQHASIHIFHVSMLKRQVLDPSHVIDYALLKIQPNMTTKCPTQIIDQKEQASQPPQWRSNQTWQ